MENNNATTQVSIVNVKMPFLSMVVFMVKAAIAFIPAFMILSIIGALTVTLLGHFFGGAWVVFNPAY